MYSQSCYVDILMSLNVMLNNPVKFLLGVLWTYVCPAICEGMWKERMNWENVAWYY
jgi:hypothetical protein